jgi:hypothetical protein
MDLDGDGYKEAEVYFEGPKVVLALLDRNDDKKIDGTIHYRDGFREYAEIDADYDGRVETWVQYYFTGLPSLIRTDKDGDGSPDSWRHFQNGFIYKKEWDRNGDGAPDYRILTEADADFRGDLDRFRTVEKQYDNDFDGTFDRTVRVKKKMPPARVGLEAGAYREVFTR